MHCIPFFETSPERHALPYWAPWEQWSRGQKRLAKQMNSVTPDSFFFDLEEICCSAKLLLRSSGAHKPDKDSFCHVWCSGQRPAGWLRYSDVMLPHQALTLVGSACAGHPTYSV